MKIKVYITSSSTNFVTICADLLEGGYNFSVKNHLDIGAIDFRFITTAYDSVDELRKDLDDLGNKCTSSYFYYMEVK